MSLPWAVPYAGMDYDNAAAAYWTASCDCGGVNDLTLRGGELVCRGRHTGPYLAGIDVRGLLRLVGEGEWT